MAPFALRRAKAGFALPTVLTMVAILTLIFITCILALHDLYLETAAANDQAAFENAAINAEGRFTWLAATEPLDPVSLQVGAARQAFDRAQPTLFAVATRSSVSELHLDGRPYQWTPRDGLNTYEIRVQDLAGLFNVDRQLDDAMRRLFTQAGASDAVAAQVADQVQDYIDVDSIRRPDGAEAPEYQRLGRPPPENRNLRSLAELGGVLAWNKLTAAQQRAVREIATAQPDDIGLNINTASVDMLMAQFGISASDARRIISTRETTPYGSMTAAGLPMGDETRTYTFPNGRFLFRISDPKRGFTYQSEITLTPGHVDRPAWILNNGVTRKNINGSERPDQYPVFPTIGAAPDG